MIRGVHAMLYTPQAEAAREFLRDVFGLPAYDVGGGWLIFDLPGGEVGCHPAEAPRHGVSFFCDDIEATVAELKARGAPSVGPIEDRGWGLAVVVAIPGGVEVEVYQPKYAKQ